uniref:Uncharacterized protein n=1 Tax=Oryza meridionalis TaxID=40149 RepID=A0A0E0F5H1_9ORYZ
MATASFVDDNLAPPPLLMTTAGATMRRPGGAQRCRGLDGGRGERGRRGEQAAVAAEEVPAVPRRAVIVAAASEAWLPVSVCGLKEVGEPYSKCLPRHRYIQTPLGCLVESVYVTIPLALVRTGLHKEFGAVRAQYGHFHIQQHMASDQHDANKEVQNSPQNEKNDMFEMSLPSLANEEKADAPTLSEEGIKGKLKGAEITQDMQPSIVVPRKYKLESSVRTTDVTSSLFCFCPKTQVGSEEGERRDRSMLLPYTVKNAPYEALREDMLRELPMLKPRTVFREEGEDDVIMPTTDTTIDHVIYP